MDKVIVEFFHDTICSFCFPMSHRMRQIARMMPEVEIVHRSFALLKTEGDFDAEFPSRAAAKDEILEHWAQANQNDDLHRFDIDGMRRADFPFPTSMPALIASKAASLVGGDAAYWDVFDALQSALFEKSRDIGAQDVIDDVVRGIDIDFDAWKKRCADPRTRDAVESDLRLAERYGIGVVPSLVINGKYLLSGALRLPQIAEAISAAVKGA